MIVLCEATVCHRKPVEATQLETQKKAKLFNTIV